MKHGSVISSKSPSEGQSALSSGNSKYAGKQERAETKRLLRLEKAALAGLDHLNAVLVEVNVVRAAASWL